MSPEDETYTPELASLADGDVLLFDPVEFEAEFNAFAVMVKEGCLFYLCRDTRKWVNVEDYGQNKPKLRKVQ